MLKYLIENKNVFKKEDIAAFVHKYLAIGISNIAINVAKAEGIKYHLSFGWRIRK